MKSGRFFPIANPDFTPVPVKAIVEIYPETPETEEKNA